MADSDPIVGIDLGTSNSAVAICDASGNAHVLADPAGYKVHPSVVSFHPNGSVIVGAQAKQRRTIDPQNTIFSVKRLIGRPYAANEVQQAKQRMPYQIVEGQNATPMIVTRAGHFAIPEISAIVLDHVRDIAANALNIGINRAVITVPANFNDAQRAATATAGAIAGITVMRVLNEPTAAALAYGHARTMPEFFAVYDLGGGTFDVSILRLKDQVYEVVGTAGHPFLGGDDFDDRLVMHMAQEFLRHHRVDLRADPLAMMRLRAAAEQTKIELSRRSQASVRIDDLARGKKGVSLSLSLEISRDQFIAMVADLADRTFEVCDEAFRTAGMRVEQVAEVILVGGSTRMPYIRHRVSQYFGREPRTDANPEEAVALGASLQAVAMQRVLSRRATSGSMRSTVPPPVASAPRTATPVPIAANPRPAGALRAAPRPSAPAFGGGMDFFEEPSASVDVLELAETPRPKSITNSMPAPADAGASAAPRSTSPTGTHATSSRAHTPTGAPGRTSRPSPAQATLAAAPPQVQPERNRPSTAAPPPTPARSGQPPSLAAALAAGQPSLPPVKSRTMLGMPAQVPPAPETPRELARHSQRLAPHLPDEAMPHSAVHGVPGTTIAPPFRDPASGLHPVVRRSGAQAVVVDVIPHAFGIATAGGFCEELLARHSRLPTERKRVFATLRDNQELVRIRVCQGQSRRLDENTVLGDLVLSNLPARPRGETSIEVTFAIDASGILQVRAKDVASGAEQLAALDLIGGMKSDDIAQARAKLDALKK